MSCHCNTVPLARTESDVILALSESGVNGRKWTDQNEINVGEKQRWDKLWFSAASKPYYTRLQSTFAIQSRFRHFKINLVSIFENCGNIKMLVKCFFYKHQNREVPPFNLCCISKFPIDEVVVSLCARPCY